MAKHSLKIGDILTSTWGYSMQIVDFYKVIKTTPHTVTLVQIESKDNVATGFLSGTVMPDPQNEMTETDWKALPSFGEVRPKKKIIFTRKINGEDRYGLCRDKNGHSSCHLWDGKPKNYNHCD